VTCGVGEGGEGGVAFFFSSRCSFSCTVLSTMVLTHSFTACPSRPSSPRLPVSPSSHAPPRL
jgi:hypothetical protein